MTKAGYTYIITNKPYGTLYTGVTSDLVKRIWQHKKGEIDGFSKQHSLHRLVFFEVFDDIASAIAREKAIKEWKRDWKINHIEAMNPNWQDLYDSIIR